MSTIRIPRKKIAAWLGPNGEHWRQGEWGDDADGCLHQAIRQCCPIPGDAHLIEQVSRSKGWDTSWNDAAKTTWADIEALLGSDRMTVTDQDLADTFGPQWEPIVALVRRVAVLTADEARSLNDAWAAARAAAGDAARAAVWAAARAAAGAAARNAAGDAARDAARAAARAAAGAAARNAAGDAAWALAVRDLVGQHGFTQEHYDTLTQPWKEVIGKVHPADTDRLIDRSDT